MYDSFDNTYQATIGIDFLSKTMYLEVTKLICLKVSTFVPPEYIFPNCWAGLQILYIWATGLRAKKSLGAKNPRRKGKKEEKGRENKKRREGVWRKESGRSWKRVVKKEETKKG